MATLTGLRRAQRAPIRHARSSVQVCCNVSAGTCAVDFVDFRFVSFDGVAAVPDSSETSALQGDFLLAGIAGGRKRAVDGKTVEGRLSGERASRVRIKMLMLVTIGMVITRSWPLLLIAVIRSTRTRGSEPTGCGLTHPQGGRSRGCANAVPGSADANSSRVSLSGWSSNPRNGRGLVGDGLQAGQDLGEEGEEVRDLREGTHRGGQFHDREAASL